MTTSFSKKILTRHLQNPKIKVLKKFKGTKAINIAKLIFFPNDPLKGKKWLKNLTESEKRNAFAYFYSRLKIKNKIIVFLIIIGNEKTGSVSGQKFDYDTGMKIIKSL